MKDVAIMLKDYHNAIVITAEQKIDRKLTDSEILGIENVHSFLMLESLKMTMTYGSVEQIEEAIGHFAKQTTIFKLK